MENENDLYKYSEEIDGLIKKVVEHELGVSVASCSKIQKGEYNYVYKLEAASGNVVARVFSRKSWPDDKYPWIEEQLAQKGVDHPKLLHYSRSGEYFPFGFMVSEYVEGQNGSDAINNGAISFDEFHEGLGALMKKVHSIRLEKFGYVNNGQGTQADYLDYKDNELKGLYGKIQDEEYQLLREKIIQRLREILGKYKDRMMPALVHGDATPDNCIFTPQRKIVLLDWDHAMSDIWIDDYACLMYFGSHLSLQGSLEERRMKIKEYFLKGYGKTDFTADEIDEMRQALEIYKAGKLIAYYHGFQREDQMVKTKNRLMGLLA